MLVVAWLERYRPQQPVGLPEALNKALRAQAGPSLGKVNNPQGLGGKSNKTIDNFDNCQNYQSEETKLPKTLGESGGTSKDYTLARLERDNAALYERVKMRELSANAACL